jgi:hypothetical protein
MLVAEERAIAGSGMVTSASSASRVNILGVGIAPTTMEKAVALFESWRTSGLRHYACFVTAHGLVSAQRDRAVRDAINRSSLAVCDGMPLVWWCRRAGFRHAGRVCGPDLMDALCARSALQGHRHYFYGGSPEVLQKLVDRLQQRHPGLLVAGYCSPPRIDSAGGCRRRGGDKRGRARFRLGRIGHAEAGAVDGGACRPRPCGGAAWSWRSLRFSRGHFAAGAVMDAEFWYRMDVPPG